MKRKVISILLCVLMLLALATPAFAEEIGTPYDLEDDFVARPGDDWDVPVFSTEPDDYDEDGIPIFYIAVSPDEWEKTFLDHPFYQGYTEYEEAHFILAYDGETDEASRSNWCSRCGQRQQILERRWIIGATRPRNCPQFTVSGSASWHLDILTGRTWETREVCNACGWATHPWSSQWWIDLANQHLWSWTIHCVNNSMRGTVNVIVGGAWPRHIPHQAVSFRRDSVVHGRNCQIECGRLCS